MTEQRSTTHSPRVDDALADAAATITRGGPVEARADEWRMAEPPADGDPAVEAIVEFGAPPVAGTLGEDERRRRSEVAIALRPSAFPAQRETLLRVAGEEQAPDWIIDLLEQLPLETRFDNVQQVWDALGGHDEARVGHPVREAAPSVPLAANDDQTVATTAAATAAAPRSGGRGLLLTTFDLGIGIGVTALQSAVAVTQWAVRTAEGALRPTR